MDLQSKINLVRSRIKQIRESDLFTDAEKEALIKTNNTELEMYQAEQTRLCLESASQALEEALSLPSKMNFESNKTAI